jgi:uncharacterized protein
MSEPLSINPGGRLAMRDVIGREREVARYWKVLQRQSLILSAERRIGKTHIVLKMHEEGREGFVTFYQDLEKVHGLMELILEFYRAVSSHVSRSARIKRKLISAWEKLVPDRIGALKLPRARENWKGLFATAVADVLKMLEPEDKAVFIWDELPLMLYNVKEREGADAAIQLLDLLRELRQGEHAERLRFVFTGSIGLHLILKELRVDGNANDPTNDMQDETVPPLREKDANILASRLLESLDPLPEQLPEIAATIAESVGGFPYYIHHVVDRLDQADGPVRVSDVEHAIADLVQADNDPMNMNWSVERIHLYYSKEDAALALVALDALAFQDEPVAGEALANLMRSRRPEVTDEDVRRICLLLRKDHLLTTTRDDVEPAYAFQWNLFKRWWRHN